MMTSPSVSLLIITRDYHQEAINAPRLESLFTKQNHTAVSLQKVIMMQRHVLPKPSLGNHDWQAIQCSQGNCSGPYMNYFTLPGNERTYDVDMGLMHLFVVNSNAGEPQGITSSSVQATWLRNGLAASTSCFDVVVFHHPPYSTGSHGSTVKMRWPFAAWGAEVVMNGHEHSYERLDVAGMPYFVNGLGGKSKYNFGNATSLPPGVTSKARYNAQFGAMLVTVSQTGLTSQFFNTAGTLIDTYTLSKNCATNELQNMATASP